MKYGFFIFKYNICISNKVEYLEKEDSYKNFTKFYYKNFTMVISYYLCNAMKKTFQKISLHRYLIRCITRHSTGYLTAFAIVFCPISQPSHVDIVTPRMVVSLFFRVGRHYETGPFAPVHVQKN